MAKSNYQIPFATQRRVRNPETEEWETQDGKFLLDYDNMYRDTVREDNHEFEDTLKYVGYSRGRSSAVLLFESINRPFAAQMFMTDFDKMMQTGANPQLLTGKFTFTKRGQNYGVKYIGQ